MRTQTLTIGDILAVATPLLSKVKIPTASLDAEILLSSVLDRDRSFLFAHPEHILSKKEYSRFARYIARRSRRIPIAYILGVKEFYSLNFFVSPAALIPRPETELLVDSALELIRDDLSIKNIVDVGTGSGCIPIAIAKNTPRQLSITTYDTSPESLTLARKNARHHTTLIKIFKGDLLEKHRGAIDILCANLPYLSPAEYRAAIKSYPELKCEPRGALVAPNHGLTYITKLLRQAKHIMHHGAILLEIGATQSTEIKKIAHTYFPAARITIIKDLARRPRVLRIVLD